MIVTSPNELTPIEQYDNILLKRDDLFIPYEINGVNGGKLRQCIMLLQDQGKDKHIYTYSSLDSPQSPITAAVSKDLKLPCTVYYGGTNINSAMKHHMARLSSYYGAEINTTVNSGRHSVLHHAIKEIVTNNDFIVEYGINLELHHNILLSAVANQVENIPNNLNNLVIICGSGITAAGVIIGLKKFNKEVKNIILVATAPNRTEKIKQLTSLYDAYRPFTIEDLFHQPGFSYTKKEPYSFHNIELHPNYEAKGMKWFLQSDINKENSLFWITGAYPKLDIKS